MSASPQLQRDGLTPEKIDNLVSRWRQNRQLYPGWVITPPDNRDTLWVRTREWIEPILLRVPATPPDRALIWLHEMTWRCEKCLVPLWSGYATRIKEVLDRVRPFPELPISTSTQLFPNSENINAYDWGGLSEAWIALSLSLLRYHRETLARPEFQELGEQLLLLSRLGPRIAPFVFYQRCLFALERLDYAASTIAIAEWEHTNESDPFWLARRAAIRAEIGDIEVADRETELALRTLREAAGRGRLASSGAVDLYSLSREGWIMALARGIKASRSFSEGRLPTHSLGRWDQLAAVRCNPWVDLETLEILLGGPAPKPPSPVERTRSAFVFHFSSESSLDRLKPALQAARLLEEAGYPIRAGEMGMGLTLLKRAAEWLSGEYPERALPLLMRLSDDEAVRGFLSDHRVAVFESRTSDSVRAIARTALDQAVTDFLAANSRVRSGAATSAERRAALSLRVLEAFALRLHGADLGDLLNAALTLRGNPRIAQDHALLAPLHDLTSRTFSCMSAQERSRHLLEIVSQPLLGVDYNTLLNRWSQDAALGISWPIDPPDRRVRPQEWEDTIRRLLRYVRQGPETARAQAVWRCALLNRTRVLDASEKNQLIALLWDSSDGRYVSELPLIPPWTILLLPEPEPGRAASALKARILAEPLPKYGNKVEQPDGTLRMQWQVRGGIDDPLASALNATEKPWEKAHERFLPAVTWTLEEIMRLLEIMEAWWKDEGHDLARGVAVAFTPFATPRFQLMTEVLGYVVLPSMPRVSAQFEGADVYERANALISEMEAEHLSVERALPIRLAIAGAKEGVASRLRTALVSNDRERYVAAIEAVYLWSVHSASPLPLPPEDLVREVGAGVRTRRTPALETALAFSTRLLASSPTRLGDLIVDDVRVGLEYLVEELKYRNPAEYSGPVPYEDVPRFRLLSARLAGELARRVGTGDPAVHAWVRELANDPLNYVRTWQQPEGA